MTTDMPPSCDLLMHNEYGRAFSSFFKGEPMNTAIAQKETTFNSMSYKDYVREIEALIKRKKHGDALQLLIDAFQYYPDNPVLLSYRGYVEAITMKNYLNSEEICKYAFSVLKKQMPLCDSFFLPILYLNLGRVYIARNDKEKAFQAFKKGYDIDKKNVYILDELRKLGIRKKPIYPFLNRSNTINKFIGKLFYRLEIWNPQRK